MSKQCWMCNSELTGGVDTFGWPDPMCWSCYADLNSCVGATWYGLAPHHHDLSITGHMIGSTVYDPLPEPDENGVYDLGYATFTPDPEAPGCGVYESKTIPGWR